MYKTGASQQTVDATYTCQDASRSGCSATCVSAGQSAGMRTTTRQCVLTTASSQQVVDASCCGGCPSTTTLCPAVQQCPTYRCQDVSRSGCSATCVSAGQSAGMRTTTRQCVLTTAASQQVVDASLCSGAHMSIHISIHVHTQVVDASRYGGCAWTCA